MADALCLSSDAQKITHFLQIPASLTREVQQDSPFSEVHALNAAARYSRGDYIGRIDQDPIVGTTFFEWFKSPTTNQLLLGTPAPLSLFFSQRREIPTFAVSHAPSENQVALGISRYRRFLFLKTHISKDSSLFWTSAVRIWLMHRDRWFECTGYNERFIYRNEMEVEMASRLMKNTLW
ncbi:MAG: hypothetical protein J6386_25030 [Candidatus Synoicihabitans palmerolidicus]|nr:hypothetical protein [Candidatus Synoicihabitans palmerolidicus]